MPGVSVCVPVLKRYDLLRDLFVSLNASTVQPDRVYVVNNGRDVERLNKALEMLQSEAVILMPDVPMGLAESWNWFIEKTSDERLIVNDDITLAPESIAAFQATEGDLVEHVGINMCSCFLLRDSCIAKVGVFDEAISPGYAYFEDCDYAERIEIVGARRAAIDCGVKHVGSATPSLYSAAENEEHNRRFLVAQENFIAKWGRMPKGIQAPLGQPILMTRQR